jgi:hypothetical protein
MAHALPMLQTYKNVEGLFKRIQSAKQPEAFTHNFLYETLGLRSVGDRPLISFLRTLGFLDAANKPTPEYGKLKNEAEASKAIGRAVKRAYAPLFAANEKAHKLPQDQLRGLIAQVAGSDASTTGKIMGTLNALLKLAEFEDASQGLPMKPEVDEKPKDKMEEETGSIKTEFHYNLQIHLPANATEESYLNIFNALRKVFK